MAANPLNAFLQGFAVVDQMETNREIRADRKQNRSRLNTLWERQDQEFERAELDRYRQKKLIDFDATMQDVVMQMEADDPGFLDVEAAGGKVAGFARVTNEVIRRMIEADPEFGEHIAKALGLDPASGPLIRDSSKPVSGIGLIPGELSPDGKGGLVVEVDSVNGPQPMTDNRSSAGNDPITMRQLGLKELVSIFGQGVRKNDILAAQQLRHAIGEDKVTGNPFKASQEAQSEKRPQSISVDEEGNDIPISHRGQLQEDGSRIRSGEGTLDDGSVIGADGVITGAPGEFQARQAEEIARLEAEGIQVGARTEGGDQEQKQKQAQEVFGSRFDRIKANIQQTIDEVGSVDNSTESGPLVQGLMDGIVSNVESLFGVEEVDPNKISDSINKPAVDKAATNLNDIDADPRDYTAKKVSTEQGAADAMATTPAASPEGVQSISKSLVARPNKRASTIELYNVLSLQRATGLFSSEQILNFARTGRFDKPAIRKLKFFEVDGVVTSFDESTGQPVTQTRIGGGEGSGLPDIGDQQALLNLLQDSTKGLFEDNPQGQQQFIDAAEGTYTILGLPGDDEEGLKARATPDVLNSIVRGASYVKNFDEDTTQNLFQGTGDFNMLPGSDLKLPMTPGNLALGYAANESGITSQGAADEFLVAYGGELQSHFKFNGREMYLNAIDKEATVMARLAAGRNPSHEDHEKYKGMSRAKIRREYVEELISDDARQ